MAEMVKGSRLCVNARAIEAIVVFRPQRTAVRFGFLPQLYEVAEEHLVRPVAPVAGPGPATHVFECGFIDGEEHVDSRVKPSGDPGCKGHPLTHSGGST